MAEETVAGEMQKHEPNETGDQSVAMNETTPSGEDDSPQVASPPSAAQSGWTRVTEARASTTQPPERIASPTTNALTAEQAVIHVITDATPTAEHPVEEELFERADAVAQHAFKFGWVTTDDEFRRLLRTVNSAIRQGINPERIRQGSSGSYFVLNAQREIVGVFKPRTEEPYGHLNPKLIKCLHRTCCPCFFGRSCVLPNTGFLSEAAASVVDRQLGLNVVPRTEIVRLAAPSFHYGYWARMRAKSKSGRYPEKLGSFQLFVENFREAAVVMPEFEASYGILSPDLKAAFQREFERLVILDYAIRNTDRSMENWMVHISWQRTDCEDGEEREDGEDGEERENDGKNAAASAEIQKSASIGFHWSNKANVSYMIPQSTRNRRPVVKIAAIDNGLAFPFKHPDNWRTYPYSWLSLTCASQPFSDQTCAEFIPILSDPTAWDAMIGSLRLLYQADPFGFDERIFDRQMAILRGQLHNILEALMRRESPLALAQKPLLLIEEDEHYYVGPDGTTTNTGTDDMLPYARRMKKREVPRRAWFSFC